MDVDLRKVRYFVALAESLHFGRAAEALHIAQPVLSRQIRALETELKAQLFVRDKRTTELTEAGRQLLADAKPLLAGADALRRRVGRAARGSDTFTVGFMPGLIVTSAVRTLLARHPGLNVEVIRTSFADQTDVIHDGRADISYVRLPIDRSGLRVRQLTTEPRVVVLPAEHRLAGKDSVEVADLAGEHLVQDPDLVPEWRDIADEVTAGRRRAEPAIHSVEEKLERIAAGRGVAVFPLSTAVYYTRPDIVHVAVRDIGPSEVCLAWESTRRSPLIAEFAAIAEESVCTSGIPPSSATHRARPAR